jgi:hypothetical protein
VEDLDAEVEIISLGEDQREYKNVSQRESRLLRTEAHKRWFDEGCSELLDQRKQAKLQWLQDPSEINGDNLNNVRREASSHFTSKKRDYLKDNINELATKSKNKNIRDIYRGRNEFKRG